MIVSTAIDVLPVLRSPMISSRWPRPRANRASIVRMPVCTGSRNQFALDDRRRGCLDRVVRSGVDRRAAIKRATERIDDATEKAGANRRPDHRPSAVHRVAGLDRFGIIEQDTADQVRSSVCAKPSWPPWNRSTSSSRTEGRPETIAIPSPMASTRPKSSITGPSWAVATRSTALLKPRRVARHPGSAPGRCGPDLPASCCAACHASRAVRRPRSATDRPRSGAPACRQDTVLSMFACRPTASGHPDGPP